jgi:5-methylcytosine-specific restriction protein A
VREWTRRFTAAVIALLPLEAKSDIATSTELAGYPEGALTKVEVNRYERDRRNRTAALAIHGCHCAACGMNFENVYGPVAAGFIEIHHTAPVSSLGDEYVIDPRADLIPLCSNCHSVAHKKAPPYSIVEIRGFLSENAN